MPAGAEIALPDGSTPTFEETENEARYALPIGPHDGDELRTLPAEGQVTRRAWRIGGTGLSSFQVMITLRQQLVDDGYEVLFECDASSCGGYDFRFGTDVIGEPDMHVDLGDFQFLSARIPGDTGQYASIFVSRSASSAYVQVISVAPADAAQPEVVTSTKTDPTAMPDEATGSLGEAMETIGRYIMTDLSFETGSASLGDGQYDSLAAIATYLDAHPSARVALVGHTDAEGSLAANIAISEQRAISVMERLVSRYGVAADRLEAKGIGYLAPIASNQTDDGRTRNRRVEAILISTE
ncbi:OmpA family protein [Maritimibacter sp. DP4N28-5]|uniref:OmpA family protein n=2 Tax=Maritimibacter dapengensis TaxID=2836868 RepID=A0ABS6T571_9RHOB|nr:OmpA family protein [Maritimibacter dapengensis]MBV7380382.1 OmpA family protein [Maritimibacter dapengensis]